MRTNRVSHFRDLAAAQRFAAVYARALAALPEPSATHDVATDFGTVRVYRFGAHRDGAAPIVLLAGRSASTPMWQPNLAALAAEREVYAIDALGEPGASVQTRAIANAGDYAAWLAQTLAVLQLGAVHIAGVSIGGWMACNLAIRAPACVRSAILIEPVASFAPLSWKVIVVSLGAALPLLPQPARNALLSWISGGERVSDDDPIAALIAAGMREYQIKLAPPQAPSEAQLRALQLPVLALFGGRSIVHDARRAETRCRELLAHGQVERWPEASHAIHGEQPERVVRRMLAFVAQVERAQI